MNDPGQLLPLCGPQFPHLKNGSRETRGCRSEEAGLWRQTILSLSPALSFTNYVTLGKSLLGQSLSFLPCKMGKEAGREGVGDL